jgi:Protein of unknown function (DUF2589)
MPANFGAELQQLPLQYMLSEPLTAVIKAQALAAQTTIQFIQSFGLTDTSGGGATPTWTAKTVDFTYSHQVPDPQNPGQTVSVTSSLTVPLLAIIPIPYIQAKDLNVSFEFKIRDVQSSESLTKVTGTTSYDFTQNVKGSWGGGVLGILGGPSGSADETSHFNLTVSATYQSTNRAELDRSATFKMTMNAVQDQIPEGLARVLTILNDAITTQKSGA